MIAQLTGKLLQKHPTAVVIDVQGVGYEVIIPLSTYYEIGEVGSTVSLLTYTYVREDALQLYGFHTARERDLFLRLISVSGVGPKLAITILSGLSVDQLIPAIRTNDVARLMAIPGVGKKTAERLIVELRDKLVALSSDEAEAAYRQMSAAEAADEEVKRDVISALMNLGYPRPLAERAVTAALESETDHSTEWILKQALKRLFR
ncbi:MAG TPA: Holliday junction branch migration protein RuvA [Blastocatellia bacterium]|nr:Holliday junction branch migration protein RuvA [Blastocatellia bacterium]